MSSPIVRTLFALAIPYALGCSSGDTKPETPANDAGATQNPAEAGANPTPRTDDGGPPPRGACSYSNAFTQGPECVEYLGSSWTTEAMKGDCDKRRNNALVQGSACPAEATVGVCLLATGTDTETRVVFPGSDASQCATDKLGCETFGGGTFVPNTPCVGK